MRVLAIDTAVRRADRGYALVEDGRVLLCDHRPLEVSTPVDWVVTERPWLSPKLRGDRLITFSVNLGFQLRGALGDAPPPAQGWASIPVRVWKEALFPGCAGMPGDVFCNNIRQAFAPQETNHNILDALGQGIAACRLGPAELKKYSKEGFRR